jgi:hypothetical protein
MESTETARECVFCYGDIDVRASHCRHCGRSQPSESTGPGVPWGLWISVAGLAPAALLGWMGFSRVAAFFLTGGVGMGSEGGLGLVLELLPYVLALVASGLWALFFVRKLRRWRKPRDTPPSTTV